MHDAANILAFGEILWDLLPSGRKLGGAPFNFACRAESLGDRGWMVSRVGRDDLGREAREAAVGLGMDVTGLQDDPEHPTGTVDVTFHDGEPDYVIHPQVAYDFIEFTPQLLELAGRADCVCFGTLAQRHEVSRATCRRVLESARQALPVLDINFRKDCYDATIVRESLELAKVVKLNGGELRELQSMLDLEGESLDELALSLVGRFELACCVATLGPAGALAATETHVRYVPGYEVAVADTVGAGDAFSAGFLHRYLRGEAVEACCRYGNAVGAIVATQTGATDPLGPGDVEQFQAESPAQCIEQAFAHLTA
jgi:fructokinase